MRITHGDEVCQQWRLSSTSALQPRRRNQGGGLTKDGSWSIITGETGLAHTGAEDMSVRNSNYGLNQPCEIVRRPKDVAAYRDRPKLRSKLQIWEGSYPLSMTRAATSSVDDKTHQHDILSTY